jgi:hypothetical protein
MRTGCAPRRGGERPETPRAGFRARRRADRRALRRRGVTGTAAPGPVCTSRGGPRSPSSRCPEVSSVKAGEWWPIQRCRRSPFMPDSISSEAHVWRSVWNPTPGSSARSAAGTSTRRRRLPTSAGAPSRPGNTSAPAAASRQHDRGGRILLEHPLGHRRVERNAQRCEALAIERSHSRPWRPRRLVSQSVKRCSAARSTSRTCTRRSKYSSAHVSSSRRYSRRVFSRTLPRPLPA